VRLILGIGNPGREYDGTRHNVGFAVADLLAARGGAPAWSRRFEADAAELRLGDARALLLKPRTYVNLSGATALAACAFFKVAPADLLVLVDDIHLPLGDLRLRTQGSAGGHNGLKDIAARLGDGYHRLRIGVGAPPRGRDQVGWVLGRFAPDESADATAMLAKAAHIAALWLSGGADAAQRLNGPLRPPPPKPRPPPPAPPAAPPPPAPPPA
jgi:PTH1 family peptidyl-tRNA hydrolase